VEWIAPESTAGDGRYGAVNVSTGAWTSHDSITCEDNDDRLDCLSNAEPHLFADGFEVGDTLHWTSAQEPPP